MKKFFRFSRACIVNRVILVKLICTLVDGHPPQYGNPADFSDDSNSSTKSTATSTLNWNDMNTAIDEFLYVYHTRHHVFVESDRQLTRMKTFEVGTGSMYQAYLLKFSVVYEGDGQRVSSSVVVKVPQRESNRKREERLKHYLKERYMYAHIFPIMYNFWFHETLSPEFYGVFTQSETLIVENLNESGYYTAKWSVTSVFTCVQVFKHLARFHALSILYLNKEGPEIMNHITVNGSERLRSGSVDHYIMREDFRKYVKPYLSTDMQEKFEYVVSNASTIIEPGYSNAKGFNVILHGEPNRTNVFFHYGIKEVKCKFMDFQDSRVGSPAIDLINYLITSVQVELFVEKGDTLFKAYFYEFCKTTRALNYEREVPYDPQKLLIDLRKYKMFFLYKLTFNAPLFWTEPHTTAGSAVGEGNYDFLWTKESFVRTYIKWMRVILSW